MSLKEKNYLQCSARHTHTLTLKRFQVCALLFVQFGLENKADDERLK